jgi:hypothetical protein
MSIHFKLLPPPDGDTTKELVFRCEGEGCGEEVKGSYLVNHARTIHGTWQLTVDTIPSYDLDTATGRSTQDDWNRD